MCSATATKLSAESKVQNFYIYLSIKEYVLWLQVSGDNVPLESILHSRYHLQENSSSLILGHVGMVL